MKPKIKAKVKEATACDCPYRLEYVGEELTRLLLSRQKKTNNKNLEPIFVALSNTLNAEVQDAIRSYENFERSKTEGNRLQFENKMNKAKELIRQNLSVFLD
jgi:hypothetical protein